MGYNLIRAKQKFLRKHKWACKSSWSQPGSLKSFKTENSLEFGKSCAELSWKSPNLNTSSIRDERYCWESSTKSERRNFSSTAPIRIGWKMVGWFYGMLLLSSKCRRPPGRWENSLWKTNQRTIQRTNNSFWNDGWRSPDFNTRPIKTSPNWQDRFARNISWVCNDRWEIFWLQIWKIWKSWTRQKCFLEDSMRKKYCSTKGRRVHIPNSRWYSENCLEEPTISVNPLKGGNKS